MNSFVDVHTKCTSKQAKMVLLILHISARKIKKSLKMDLDAPPPNVDVDAIATSTACCDLDL